MPSAEAQRTLVKSPPELWSELSDPVSLARHLGDVGEIRIARVEAETKVEWEAESASGTVELKPSGWGTKVTLTIAREAPEPVVAKPESEPQPEHIAEPEPMPQAQAAPDSPPEPETQAVPRAERERRFRRLARWLWWPRITPRPAAQLEPEPPQPEPEPETEATESPDLAAELAAELARLEATMAEQDAALLAAALDRLGAAHHRPFSRG